LPEALELLGRFGDEAKVLSGGQSLLPLLKLRFAQPGHLVDIGRIPGLDYIKEEGGFLRIGALVREAALEASPLVRSKYPILTDTAAVIADPLVRNLATVAGNLAHGDPANDHPATMLAVGAEVVLTGPKGSRTVPIAQFFTGLFTTALAPTEVLSEIRIPVPPAGSGGAYLKLERKVGDFATVGVAAIVRLTSDGTIGSSGIGITGVADTPFAATDAEKVLDGQKPSDDLFRKAGEAAAAMSSPVGDVRGPTDYKRAMTAEMTLRSLRKAVERALAYA
jgi:carbon-monoxide dehydrogenase medium subunit